MAGFQEVALRAAMYRTRRTAAAAGDRPVAPPRAAVAIDRSDADEGGNPASIEAPELGQLGDQGAGGDLADAGHRGQQVLGGAPGQGADLAVDLLVELGQRRLEGRERALDAVHDPGAARLAPALLSMPIISTIWRRLATSSARIWVCSSSTGRGSGRTCSAKRAISSASSRSVLARRPMARAKRGSGPD